MVASESVLQLFNTLKKQKEAFEPADKNHVKLYLCGPTVYNRIHIGNARPMVIIDVLFRVLSQLYPKVSYARNITDVDDKIITASQEEGVSIGDITHRFTEAFHQDMAVLNNVAPTIEPKATTHIADMIGIIEKLIAGNHAYESAGHVLFSVKSMNDYGKLSGRSLDDMLAGARVEVAEYKQFAGDFVLWKPAAADEPGWDSPFGYGRPGWHLECSAMIYRHFGESIDIHAGGRDLIFPHHENEIAQSECAHGTEFVRYWLHNGYVNIDGEKMSKSLGNFKMLNHLLDHYPGEVLRYALLSAHYRSDMNFSDSLLTQAKNSLDSLYSYLLAVDDVEVSKTVDVENTAVFKALLDDLNTPIALSELHQLGKKMKKSPDQSKVIKAQFLALADFLGLCQQPPESWFQHDQAGAMPTEEVEALINEMKKARDEKDFERADLIRSQLQDAGIQLMRDGWKRS